MLAAIAAVFCAAPSGRASTYVFATAPGALSGGKPVDVKVTLTLDPTTDSLTVQILNLESAPDLTRDFQLVSSLQITFGSLGSSPTAPSVTSYSFGAINIANSGNNAASIATTPANTWQAYSLTSGVLTFCTNCPNNGNSDLIIGSPDANGNYPGANNAVTGSAHQPYLMGSGQTYLTGALKGINANPEWVLYIPQMQANTTVTNVTIGYGTAWGTDTTTTSPQSPNIPEVAPSGLVLTGLLGIALAGRFRPKTKAAKGDASVAAS